MRWPIFALILSCGMDAHANEDLCLTVSALGFSGKPITRVCQSSVHRLLDRPLNFDYTLGPLQKRDGQVLRTCRQYNNNVGLGDLAGSRMESMLEYGTYMSTCKTLYAVERAAKPTTSFFGENPLDLRILPPVFLPNGPTYDAQQELEDSFARGESAEDFLSGLARKHSGFNREHYLEGWRVVLHARADFDGDGLEDALVSFSYSDPTPGAHYFGYGMGVLRRTSPDSPAEWVEFRDFKWRAPNNTLQRTQGAAERAR